MICSLLGPYFLAEIFNQLFTFPQNKICIYASIWTARRDAHVHTLSSFFLSLASTQQQKVCYEERRIVNGNYEAVLMVITILRRI